MTTSAHRFTLQHLVAAAALAGTGTALFLNKLDVLAVRLSPAIRQVCAQWWPLLLIVTGGILWLIHANSQNPKGRGATMATTVTRETTR